MIIREARAGDVESLMALVTQSWEALIVFTNETFRAQYERNIKYFQQNEAAKLAEVYQGDNRFFVACEEGNPDNVLGCVSVSRACADEAKLSNMAVLQHLRGQMIGSLLLAHAMEFAKSRYCRVKLVTENPLAANFYRKHGFLEYATVVNALVTDK